MKSGAPPIARVATLANVPTAYRCRSLETQTHGDLNLPISITTEGAANLGIFPDATLPLGSEK